MYIISVAFQGQTFDSHITKNFERINMADMCHLSNTELSGVTVFINENDETMIDVDDKVSLVIERYGRKHRCQPNHPLLLLTHDILWMGESPVLRFEIVKIRHIADVVPKSKLSKNLMVAGAAALVMASVVSCNKTAGNMPNPNPVVEDSDDATPDSKVDEQKPNEPYPEPQVVGEPAVPEEPYPEPQIIGEAANLADPYPEPQVVGIPPVQEDPYPEPEIVGKPAPEDVHPVPRPVGTVQAQIKDPQDGEDEPIKKKAMPEPRVVGKMVDPDSIPKDDADAQDDTKAAPHPKRVGKPAAYPKVTGRPII